MKMVKEFINAEDAYFKALAEYPSGYVLNSHKNPKPDYMVLHRATCRSISVKQHSFKEGRFTERDFLKVVAVDEQELRDYLRGKYHWFNNFSHLCGQCCKGHHTA